MKFLTSFKRLFWRLSVLCLFVPMSSWAQFKVDVAGVGMTQLPIAVVTFKGEDIAPQKTSAIVLADLERSGQFRSVVVPGMSMDELTRPDFRRFAKEVLMLCSQAVRHDWQTVVMKSVPSYGTW